MSSLLPTRWLTSAHIVTCTTQGYVRIYPIKLRIVAKQGSLMNGQIYTSYLSSHIVLIAGSNQTFCAFVFFVYKQLCISHLASCLETCSLMQSHPRFFPSTKAVIIKLARYALITPFLCSSHDMRPRQAHYTKTTPERLSQ